MRKKSLLMLLLFLEGLYLAGCMSSKGKFCEYGDIKDVNYIIYQSMEGVYVYEVCDFARSGLSGITLVINRPLDEEGDWSFVKGCRQGCPLGSLLGVSAYDFVEDKNGNQSIVVDGKSVVLFADNKEILKSLLRGFCPAVLSDSKTSAGLIDGENGTDD